MLCTGRSSPIRCALLSHRLDTEGPRNEEFLYLRFEVWGLTRQSTNTTINPLLGKESE